MERVYLDNYERTFGFGEDELKALIETVDQKEKNSVWHRGEEGITASQCSLMALDPMQVMADGIEKLYRLEHDLLEETMSSGGTHLLFIVKGFASLLRSCAIQSVSQACKLWGSALGKMAPYMYAEVVNDAFSVGSGKLLLLERYGMLTAIHSDAEGGYEIMPISALLKTTLDALRSPQFKEVEMLKGYDSHEYTSATFILTGIQQEVLNRYQNILDAIGSKHKAYEFTPAVRFRTSDTSAACATLEPVFLTANGAEFKFCEGVEVKHRRIPGAPGKPMDDFRAGANNMFAKFEEAYTNMEALAQRQVYHPKNFVISACKKLRIPKKYGQAALEEAEYAAEGVAYVNGHDMYLVMTKVVEAAIQGTAPARTILDLDEKVSKVPTLDWSEHDVGGTVAWAD